MITEGLGDQQFKAIAGESATGGLPEAPSILPPVIASASRDGQV